MTAKIFRCFVYFLACVLFTSIQVLAQSIKVENSPRPFTVIPPTSWIQQPTTTGNSRIKFAAPVGTPAAECAVIVKEFPGLRDLPQTTFDQKMAEPPNSGQLASQLSLGFNNVSVLSVGNNSVSGHPAQLANVQYSAGTQVGPSWFRGIQMTTATTPGLIWTISCGALGENLDEALKGYSYWQMEIIRFTTNITIHQ